MNRSMPCLAVLLSLLAGCSGRQAIHESVAHPDRPAEDVARDVDRQPAEVMRFFKVQRGQTIADLMAGRGYYTELLSRAVGPTGKVYLHNNAFVVEKFADEGVKERLADNRLPNVVRHDRELTALDLPAGSVDRVFMILFYHDTYWMNIDRAAMNKQIYDALKPGGYFCVIDHVAEPGSGARDVKTLHRVDPEIVKQEILDAGFVLDGESDLLRHPKDDHTLNVFKDEIRGKTDRFIYRFKKPRQ